MKTIPRFTAEFAINASNNIYNQYILNRLNSTDAVIPQMQQVICTRSGRYICCGVEDDVRGISFSLGCGRIL